MEALYDRMALSIVDNPSSEDKTLALAILQCVTCSLRILTVAELSQLLNEDTTGMLDLEKTIVDICGGFVVIDNGGNVSMIHQTAREYLLSGKANSRPLQVDRGTAHQQLFLSCMRCLMAVGLRARVSRNQKPELLDYAASLWSSHLASTPTGYEEVFDVLRKFLAGNWILTWIHVLAAGGQLRVLIQASRHLSRYSAQQRGEDTARDETDVHILEQELLDSWAIDLVKTVGKFGTILRRNPEAIYKLIPPFCPHNSPMYQQFGKPESRILAVSGLSTENWDDSLARLPFGTYASSIMAAGSQIVVLASSGIVSIFDSSVFEEAAISPIKHGERVYRMEINSNATLLATYGYKTTKIWELSSGRCKLSVSSIESRPRPLAMLFVDSATLLVGSEDRRIRSLDLTGASPAWELMAELEEPELEGHFINSSNYMALNKDGSLIAVAYRGHPLSAWETDGPVHVGHCWRKREEVSRGEVIEAVWHPHSPEVLGLYIEGVVFKWSPYDGEIEEMATGASKLAISRDGNLLATGDVHGTVKVYTFSGFSLLYQLASTDTVLGLAFSPDLRRFYDIRGRYGNAWEPNALMRFAEQTGKDTDSQFDSESLARSSTVSMSSSQRVDSITVLAASPIGRLYTCGTDKGTVSLYDTQHGKLADLHMSKSFLSIEQMVCSNEGRLMCFSDSSKRIFIMSISLKPGSVDSEPAVETLAEISMKSTTKGPLLQLLFSPDSSQLLIHASSTLHVISLGSCSIIASVELDTAAQLHWILHPQDPTRILGFGTKMIHILDWSLVKHETYGIGHRLIDDPIGQADLPDAVKLDRVLVTHDKKQILLQMTDWSHNPHEKTFLCLKTSSISTSTAEPLEQESNTDAISITPTVVAQNIASQITFALSFLPHGRLVFLSKDYSICSWQLQTSPNKTASSTPATRAASTAIRPTAPNRTSSAIVKPFKELFALPGDWISRDCLRLCRIWGKENSLLCPRNGEVALVRSAGLV